MAVLLFFRLLNSALPSFEWKWKFSEEIELGGKDERKKTSKKFGRIVNVNDVEDINEKTQ